MKKKYKRLLTSLLVFAMLIGMFIIPVDAGSIVFEEPNHDPAEFSVSTTFSQEKGAARIFVDVAENSQIAAALFKLSFDTSKLKATSVDTGLLLKNGYTSKNIASSGMVLVSYANTTPMYDGGRLFEVEFTVIGELSNGEIYEDIPVNLEVLDLKDYDAYDIPAKVNQGRITLINTAFGDVNSSEMITATDSLMALYAASKLTDLDSEQFLCADVNGDNKITPLDALLILRLSAGEISDFPIFNLESPLNVQVSDKDETYVTFTWTANNLAIGYNIYMDGIKINDEPITEKTYTVTGLLQDSKHDFEFKSVNTLKESDSATKVTVSTNKADRSVVFKNYDGTILDTQIVLSGLNAVAPEVPARKGYTFIGWDKPITNITEDTEFIAQYKINTYDVVIDYLDGSDVIVQKYDYNTLIAKPESHSREDYNFEGWYQDKTFTKKWNFDTDVVQENMTLYGNWVTWGEWTTDATLADNPDYEVESKTQYSYRDKSTTTSTSSSLSGWTQNGSYVTYGAWTDIGWTRNQPTASDTLQITNNKTVTDAAAYTLYNYYYYRYWNTNAGTYYYTYSSSMGGNKYTTSQRAPLKYVNTYSGHKGYVANSYIYYSGELWFENGTTYVPAVTHTEWYYQTRTKTTNYNYYKWSSWSDWTDNSYDATDSREVKSRTVYRYKLKGES
ncbi:MAG: InlB B-repeat-containing protein [Ruminococcus sp.]|nr:InlB B-repeat-containing protein [Ruminococcus sp.]